MKYCQKCGARVKGEEHICRNCGGPVEPDKTYTAESSKKKTFAKAEPEKNKMALMIALIVILTAIIGVSGYLYAKNMNASNDNTDTSEDNEVGNGNIENETDSEKIELKKISDPSELPYYDFVAENCENDGDAVWEDTEKLTDAGFQVDEKKVKKPYVVFEVNLRNKAKDIKEEEFNETVQILKYRLDALKTPYAIKYEKDKKSYKIWVKIGTDRMGTIVTRLLSYNGGEKSGSSVIKASDKTLLSSAEDFSFKKSPNGEYVMTITKNDISESDAKKILDFLKEHKGKNIYWVCGGIAITELKIDDGLISNFEETESFKFTELLFFDDGKKENLFPILKLMYVALKGEQYPLELEISNNDTVEFSEDADEFTFGYRTITSTDNTIASVVSSLKEESSCYRPLMMPDSGTIFNIDLIYNEEDLDEVGFLKTVKKIYEKTEGFNKGYHTVDVNALIKSDKKGVRQKAIGLRFTKESDGSYSMSCIKSGKTDEFKEFLKKDTLFSELQIK